MIDVDFFKNYNDHYGHKAGDDSLRNVASVLRSGSKRASDMTARYGGEEFAVIAAGIDLDKARELAVTLCRDVAALEIPHAQSPFGRITVSIGVAASVPEEKLTAEALLRRADEALYQAKESGRHRVVEG
jgi:diguanylate cyclase (GGDEF)-like protein